MSSLTASALAEIRAVVTGPKHGPVCHGVVTRDGHEDACGKPAVAVIGRSIAHGAAGRSPPTRASSRSTRS